MVPWLRSIVEVVVLAALAILSGYAIAYYVLPVLIPALVPVAFFSYLALGLCIVVYTLGLTRSESNAGGSAIHDLITAVRRAEARRASWAIRVQAGIDQWMDRVIAILLWPGVCFVQLLARRKSEGSVFRRRPSLWYLRRLDGIIGWIADKAGLTPGQIDSAKRLRAWDLFLSIWATAMISGFYLLSFTGIQGDGFGLWAVVLIGMSVTLRHLQYLAGAAGLPARLRRLSSEPRFDCCLIAFFDLVSLILFLTPAFDQIGPSAVGLEQVAHAVQYLVKFRSLSDLYDWIVTDPWRLVFAPPDAAGFFVAVAAILFYGAVVKTVLKKKDFEHDDEDRVWLAERHLEREEFDDAIARLSEVKESSNLSDLLKVSGFLSQNHLDEAEEIVRAFARRNDLQHDGNLLVSFLGLHCAFNTVPPHVVSSIMRKCVAAKVSDAYLARYAFMCSRLVSVGQQDILDYRGRLRGQYPLARAAFCIGMNDLIEAMRILNEAEGDLVLDKIGREVMLLQVAVGNSRTSNEQLGKLCEHWAESSLPSIVRQVSELKDPMDRAVACGQMADVHSIFLNFLPVRAPEIRTRLNGLERSIARQLDAAFSVTATKMLAQLANERYWRPHMRGMHGGRSRG